ncbi:glycoside hydrolase family 32 protein [Quadrisphaera sp. INWT6]|uniref:glycoside hydrolase family 32 protein n=1 Tax=Quadrisphaera sp. INWT6 TaxID=2596917 RepID=UPI00189280E2|nr:glycoside hydrolase family 32 protein [Quadrisphaera sp. INWT6]MBF5082413.1 glycoside hydrolase family 32 protein [Quadrisphaera sp. INWT6]
MTVKPAHGFHLAPLRGWMNDPNGLVEIAGTHHVFFQHNPHAPTFGLMHWGHATSTDLVHWTHHDTALTPGAGGPADAGGCWSGVAAPLPDGRWALLYTGIPAGRPSSPGNATGCRAVSSDPTLSAFAPDGAPALAEWPETDPPLTDWRDHALLATSNGPLRQVIAAGTCGAPGAGRLLTYRSTAPEGEEQYTAWTYESVLLHAEDAGLPGQVFECPDVWVYGDEEPSGRAGAERALVVLSWYDKVVGGHPTDDPVIASGALWLTGVLHSTPQGLRFEPEHRGVVDHGDRFYACQSYSTGDGRRLALGWLRTQDDPASRDASTVGTQSLPRHWRVVRGRLEQQAAEELVSRVGEPVAHLDAETGRAVLPAPLSQLVVDVHLDEDATAGGLSGRGVVMTGADGRSTTVDLGWTALTSTETRNDEGLWAPTARTTRSVRIFVDAGLVECFTDDGRAAAFSDLGNPTIASIHLEGAATSAVTVVVRTMDV